MQIPTNLIKVLLDAGARVTEDVIATKDPAIVQLTTEHVV